MMVVNYLKMMNRTSITTITLLCTHTIIAQTIVPIDVADQQFDSNGGSSWIGQASARVGKTSQADPVVAWDYIMPFALPTIPDGEVITSATLTVNLQGWTSFASIGDVQLFGINRVNASPGVVFASDFVDASNPSANPDAVLLQSDMIPSSAITSTGASNLTEPYTSIDISSYIQNLYDVEGGAAGEFGFLTLAVDVTTVGSSSNNYYDISTANSATTAWQPFLTIETGTVPEPGAYALIAGAAVLGLVALRRRNQQQHD